MNVDKISICHWSRTDRPGEHPFFGAGGGGTHVDVKYLTDPDPEYPFFCDMVAMVQYGLERDGHVILRNPVRLAA